ncbi:hypothetical protein M422DRAFT_783895 [Sphaerobolus stellatus SS14]|uniref:Uncharacterized protein n=1 Tax=Sphaerobolus stellatus (strain SS14) TaxID=990650 RepID=A0A0C9TLF5_SPHS4|nr:hypothetical protein M422DRAFT_783895 [Sphaerobolus stellatus SS14]
MSLGVVASLLSPEAGSPGGRNLAESIIARHRRKGHRNPTAGTNLATTKDSTIASKATTTAASKATTTAVIKATTTTASISTTAVSTDSNLPISKNGKGTTTTTTANNGNAQTSLTLDPSVFGSNPAKTGLEANADAGTVASLTTTNNFINFCVGKQIMNGLQGPNGEVLCNPVHMGGLPPVTKMVGSKFQSPKNLATIATNTAFDIVLAVSNLETGAFVNPQLNYFGTLQQLNSQNTIIGHSYVVVELINSLDDTTVTNPQKFAFFKGLNGKAVNGRLTATVSAGLPAGVYRVASINAASNHQPVLVPVAQHCALDDMVYFTVSNNVADVNNAAASAARNKAITTTAAKTTTTTKAVTTVKAVKATTTAKTTKVKTTTGGRSSRGRRFFSPSTEP